MLHNRWSHIRIATSRLLIKAARKLDPRDAGLTFNIRQTEDWHGKATRWP